MSNQDIHTIPVSRIPACTFPVGDFIREEMEERGWTVDDLVERSELPRHHVEVIMSSSGMTSTIAKGLAKAFGTSHELWQNLAGISLRDAS